jgi:hypothetical protein
LVIIIKTILKILVIQKFINLTKTGYINFEPESVNQTIKEDRYYLLDISLLKNISFSVEIFIDSRYNSQFILQKNKYFRGSFSLLNEIQNQRKIYYIQFEEEDELNNLTNNNYIIEFSSGWKDIIILFNNDFNYNKRSFEGIEKYFISSESLIKGKKYNFTIQLNNTFQYDLDENYFLSFYYGLYEPNYIIKFYKEERNYNLENLVDKDIKFKEINVSSENIYFYNFTIKSNNDIINLNNNFKYCYFFRIYIKEIIIDSQLLNTTAFTFRFDSSFSEYITDNPNKEFSIPFYIYFDKSMDNRKYFFYLFVKVIDKNNEEQYFSKLFEINTKLDNKKIKKIAIILVIFVSIFIITLLTSLVICAKYRRKNIELKKQIEEISLCNKNENENPEEIPITFV